MIRAASTLAAAFFALGCAGLGGETRPPEWQPRVDELSRSQARLEMRVDEVTRTLLALRERLEVQEAALKREKEEREKEPREDLAVPPLTVVRVEPLSRGPETPKPLAGPAAEVVPPPQVPPTVVQEPPAEEPPKAGVGGSAAAELYRRAFSAFREGRYGQAILDFEEFLRRYPDHEYADNAQYWIGECYYSQREFGEAAVEFGRVVERFPRETKAPDALLKIGLAYQQLGDLDKARAFWRRASSEYPGSEAAGNARKLLAQSP